jgi:hypothetical protein
MFRNGPHSSEICCDFDVRFTGLPWIACKLEKFIRHTGSIGLIGRNGAWSLPQTVAEANSELSILPGALGICQPLQQLFENTFLLGNLFKLTKHPFSIFTNIVAAKFLTLHVDPGQAVA